MESLTTLLICTMCTVEPCLQTSCIVMVIYSAWVAIVPYSVCARHGNLQCICVCHGNLQCMCLAW